MPLLESFHLTYGSLQTVTVCTCGGPSQLEVKCESDRDREPLSPPPPIKNVRRRWEILRRRREKFGVFMRICLTEMPWCTHHSSMMDDGPHHDRKSLWWTLMGDDHNKTLTMMDYDGRWSWQNTDMMDADGRWSWQNSDMMNADGWWSHTDGAMMGDHECTARSRWCPHPHASASPSSSAAPSTVPVCMLTPHSLTWP